MDWLDHLKESLFSLPKVCVAWTTCNHCLFQFANLFFLSTYFIHTNSKSGLFKLRLCILLGSLCFAVWGLSVICALDTIVWNLVFVLLNAFYIGQYVIDSLRAWKNESSLNAEYLNIYDSKLKPFGVTKAQALFIFSCVKETITLVPNQRFIVQGKTTCNQLSILVSGRLIVSQNGKPLHAAVPYHFLDSPEWFGASSDDYFQVTITAVEESRVLVWHRDKLRLTINSDPFLQAIFDHILGKDVVNKLIQVNESCTNGTALPTVERSEHCSINMNKHDSEKHHQSIMADKQLQALAYRTRPAAIKCNEQEPLLARLTAHHHDSVSNDFAKNNEDSSTC